MDSIFEISPSGRSGPLELGETFLESTSTSEIHRSRLRAGWVLFVRFLVREGTNNLEWVNDYDAANQILADFVNNGFTYSVKLWKIRMGVLPVQPAYRHLRFHLPRPWEAIRNWQLRQPVHNRLPMSLILLQALFATAISIALSKPD